MLFKLTPSVEALCKSAEVVRQWAITADLPLIRPCGATFPRGGRLWKPQSSRFVMLFKLTPSVEALWSRAEVAGGRMPMAPRTMRVLLKLMIKR